MEFLRRLLAQTQSYLKGMSASQRLAIGSCVALIAVSLLWLMNWASKPTLVPLLDQPMTAAELTPIQSKLDAQGVIYQVKNSTIQVPTESRARLLAQLGQDKTLPNDISIGFARMMEDPSPWLSMDEQGRRWSIARSYELSRVLSKMDGVVEARVILDEKTRRTLGAAPVTPTASIFVKMAPGSPLDKEHVYAMANMVRAAVAGLDISNIAVTDAATGHSYTVPKPAESMAFDDLEDRQKKEEYFANKIKSLLANIPGLLVAVHAELIEESKQETKLTHPGKPPMLSDKSETMTQERGAGASGPGVVPNTQRALTPAPVTERTEKSVTESSYDAKADETRTTTEAPRHGIKSLSASVNVPRSYLAAIFKGSNKGKDPTDADIDATGVNELKKVVRQVENALAIPKDSGAVEVTWFHDDAMVQLSESAPAVAASSTDTLLTYAKTYGGKAGVGALGVMGLFMMLMMVRKVSEGPVLPGEEPPAPQPRTPRRRRQNEPNVTVSADPIGRADVTEQLMVAQEVDEKTIRTQQVIEQLQGMIKDDPDSAVGILQRWIDMEKA